MLAQVQAVFFSSASSSLGVGFRLRLYASTYVVPDHCPPVRTPGCVFRTSHRAREWSRFFIGAFTLVQGCPQGLVARIKPVPGRLAGIGGPILERYFGGTGWA